MATRAAELRDSRQLRDRRSCSRDPEAFQTNQGKAAVKGNAMDQGQTDHWEEPSLSQRPSYRDHNGLPYGVLEHMQPLGEAPNVRVKTRVRSDAPRKSVLGRSAATAGLDGPDTPEGTPVPQPAPRAQTNVQSQTGPVVDDEKDADYAPSMKTMERASRSSRAGKEQSYASSTKSHPDQRRASTHGNGESNYDAVKVKRIVRAAMDRAHQVGKPDLAAAVHEIWRQSLTNARLTELLEAILSQSADAAQTEEFQKYVRAAKRKLKDAAKQSSRKLPAQSPNGTKSLPHRSPSKFTSTIPETSALPSTETSESSKAKAKIKVKSPHKDSSRRRTGQSSHMPASPAKKRTGSVGSESSLTSLTSDENGMEAVDDEMLKVDPSAPSARVNGIKAKDHAAERGSLAAPDRNLKRSSADADLAEEERDRDLAAKKRKLEDRVTHDQQYQESDMRGATAGPPTRSRAQKAKIGSLTLPSLSLAPNGNRNASTRGSRAVSTDIDSPLSELSPPSSRHSTPHIYRGPPKPPGKRAKTKTSPEKKHLLGYNGLAGAGGAGRESPIGDDDNEELSENNDFCSACGGSGFLLCCDGCDRSFHFSCLDPPLSEDASELNEPWYCYICVAKRPVTSEQTEKPHNRLFAPLLSSLRKRNPSNFSLPQYIREYYDGVGADKSGNFIEAVNTRSRTRPGYDELPDYYKTKDGKGNTILCYSCGKSSNGTRAIIQCDYCGENWHLDCLDPPLANPPARGFDGKKVYDWMCPLHADHELRRVDTRMLNPNRLGRRVHVRKPRNAKAQDAALSRGFRNNGIIDIQEDDSDDSSSEFYDEETQDEATVFRLPASGIKLDFIDKIKTTRVQQLRNERVYRKARVAASAPSALKQANFARRSFVEKQLALNLAQFALANKDLDLGRDQVENLLGTLIAEAPADVVNEMMAAEDAEKMTTTSSQIPPSPPSSDQPDQLSAQQRKELQILQELIRRRLECSKT